MKGEWRGGKQLINSSTWTMRQHEVRWWCIRDRRKQDVKKIRVATGNCSTVEEKGGLIVKTMWQCKTDSWMYRSVQNPKEVFTWNTRKWGIDMIAYPRGKHSYKEEITGDRTTADVLPQGQWWHSSYIHRQHCEEGLFFGSLTQIHFSKHVRHLHSWNREWRKIETPVSWGS